MARRVSKRSHPTRPLSPSHARAEIKSDGRWIVRTMPGTTASKTYRCPGCQALIPVSTPHVVAWPDTPSQGSEQAVDDRRHWHSACWSRRP